MVELQHPSTHGVDDARVRAHLLAENIEIGGGLGPLKGRIWRIGLMGSGSTRENVMLVLDAMHRALNAEGFSCASGIESAEAVYDLAAGVWDQD